MGNKSSKVHDASSAAQPPPSLAHYFSHQHIITIPAWWKTPINGITPEQAVESDVSGAATMYLLENRRLCPPENSEKSLNQEGHLDQPPASQSPPPLKAANKLNTPLHQAARIGDNTNILVLLLAGADVWAIDETDNIPLYYACLFGHYIAVALLLVKMGGVSQMSETDKDRFIINSLTPEIQHMLKEKVEPKGNLQLFSLLCLTSVEALSKVFGACPLEAHTESKDDDAFEGVAALFGEE